VDGEGILIKRVPRGDWKPVLKVRKRKPARSEREVPADGIEKWWDELLRHMREKCVTKEAMQSRREEVFARTGAHCEACRAWIWLDTFHLHHISGRGANGSKRCDCMNCVQAICAECHRLIHDAGKLGEWFTR
jgi:hypothetical protein